MPPPFSDPNPTSLPKPDAPPPTKGQRLVKALGPVGVALLFIFKFIGKVYVFALPALKFLPVILKTGGTMLISIWFYAATWGWRYAVGFVMLIFIHECGHLVVARRFGLKVGAPVFIPFMGAFIALKDAPRDAWMEACVGIGGPLFGAAGALVCELLYQQTGAELYRALAYSGFFLNLFNLAPVGFLDGGRIASALSPWLWIVGLVIVGAMAVLRPNFIFFLILLGSIPRLWMLFRAKSDAERRYFEVSPGRRGVMALLYFGLAAALVLGMHYSHLPPPPPALVN